MTIEQTLEIAPSAGRRDTVVRDVTTALVASGFCDAKEVIPEVAPRDRYTHRDEYTISAQSLHVTLKRVDGHYACTVCATGDTADISGMDARCKKAYTAIAGLYKN